MLNDKHSSYPNRCVFPRENGAAVRVTDERRKRYACLVMNFLGKTIAALNDGCSIKWRGKCVDLENYVGYR